MTDKDNVILKATQQTPFNFTHNAWLSDNSQFVFTTDERANAPIGSYDISNLNDIKEVDIFRPISTLGLGVIPHNVHVWEDWLIISYYTDGCIIADASKPDNIIEVGNFDTWLGGDGGFSGVWGVYPFFPSGAVVATDINNGVYVLEPDYKRACWLEGTVTDAITGAELNGVSVEIQSGQANVTETNISGVYKGGQVIPGIFDVIFNKTGYEQKTLSATLVNGLLTILDAQLDPLPSFSFTGKVLRASDDNPIPNASVQLINDDFSFETNTDANGNFSINMVFEDDYDVFAGIWGYHTQTASTSINGGNENLIFRLEEGYRDEFAVDLGWQVSGNASTGMWERGIPNGTTNQGGFSNPPADIAGDIGATAYVTGNGGGSAGDDDIDGGNTVLTSPVMDLTTYNNPILNYYSWFYNAGGSGNPNDYLSVSVDNGNETFTLETITNSEDSWNAQAEWVLSDWIEITDNMRVIFESLDQEPGHLVEAAVDVFEIVEGTPVGTAELINHNLKLAAWPNPFGQDLNIRYHLESVTTEKGMLSFYNLLGQRVLHVPVAGTSGQMTVGAELNKGIYFVRLEANGEYSKPMRVVKH